MSVDQIDILTEPVKQIICAKCGKPLDVATLAPFSRFRCGHCNAVQTVPAKFGNFVLLELLGRGGMAAVYRGLDQALGRQVAIKFMLRSLGADPEFYAQFKREARAAAALSHPNIVQIYSLGEEKGQSYIVMELLSGGRLDQMIAGRKKLDEATALRIALEVAEGLSAAHRAGLIHDDIKPENILFDSKGVAKVVDFGLAHFRGKGPQAGQNEIWGTPYYIAPEKVLRKAPDFRSDMYSLGGTLFHALAGRPPFEGDTAVDVVKARLQQPVPDVRQIRPDIRPETAALLARLLEREPGKRPSSYEQLLAELRKLAGVGPGQTSPIAGESITGRSTRIRIKGKKSISPPDVEGASAAAEEGAEAEKEERNVRRKRWPVVAIVLLAVLALAGVVTGITVMAVRRKAKKIGEEKRAALVDVQKQSRAAHAAIMNAATGVLAEAETMFFYDVAATGRLAEARQILDGMGEQAQLVTLPELPDDGMVARQVEEPVVNGFTGLTNLEAICAESDAIAARIEAANVAELAESQNGLTRLKALAETVSPLAMALEETRKKAARVIEDAEGWVVKARECREAGIQEAAKREAEEAARKKREAEEAEKKRLEEERLARIEAERAAVRAAWDVNAERMRKNQFEEAADALKEGLAKLETVEGKADAKAAEDRCRLLADMKLFLVAAIQEKPLRWGWFTTAGQIDISGANEAGIMVRGVLESWTGVDARQMLKFIDSYIKNEDAREKAGKRGWAKLHLAAAVYCYIQGNRAYQAARNYRALAVQYDSKLESEALRLMPELPKE